MSETQTVLANGKPHKFPAELTRKQIGELLEERYGAVPAPVETDTPIADFLGRTKEAIAQGVNTAQDFLKETGEEVLYGGSTKYQEAPAQKFMGRLEADTTRQDLALTDTIASMAGLDAQQQRTMGIPSNTRPLYDPVAGAASNRAGSLEGGVQMAGNIVDRMASAVGNSVVTLAEAGVDALPEPVIEYASGQWDEFLETKVAKVGINMLKEAGEFAAPYIKKYPQEAKTIMALVEAGTLAIPVSKGADKAFEAGTKMLTEGKDQVAKEFASELLAPINKIPDATRRGKTDAEGVLQQTVYKPTETDIELGRILEGVPGTSPNRSAAYNVGRTVDEVSILRKSLDADIRRAGNPDVDVAALNRKMEEVVENFEADPETMVLTGDAKTLAEKILRHTTHLLETSDGTALGVLDARRELDSFIEVALNGAFDPTSVSARTVSTRYIRRLINDAVADAVPNVDLKGSLSHQSSLLTARDYLNDQVRAQGHNIIGRLMQNLGQTHVGPVGAYTLSGILATAGDSLGLPVGTGQLAGAAGATVMAAYTTWNSATRKKVLGGLIKETSRLIKTGSNVDQLKADRLFLIDMLQAEDAQEKKPQ